MWMLLDVVLDLAMEFAIACCSWRLWLCILVSIGIVASGYYRFPEYDGIWAVTTPIAIMILVFGFWWQWRKDR